MKAQLNRICSILLSVAVLTAAFLVGTATTSAAKAEDKARINEPSAGYLVRFASGVSRSDASMTLYSAGLAESQWIDHLGVAVVSPIAGTAVAPGAAETLASSNDVLYVEPNYLLTGEETPNDPYFPTYQYAPQKIGAPAAWDTTTGSVDVVVAVLDTGLDTSHADMQGQYLSGYDFVNSDSDPSDDHGHGTHVSGIVGAYTNNSNGVASIGRATAILPVKVLNSANQGTHGVVAQGILWATDQGADIINLSLGSTASSTTLEDAIEYAVTNGVLVVAAAGNNSSTTPFYPAAYDDVMGIAATDYYDNRWTGSNYGSWISMAAPGASIYSTDWSGGAGAYAFRSGTSQAAPHVAGVAALMLAVDGSLSAGQLRSGLESSALDLGATGFDNDFGWGRLDAAAAVSAVSNSPTATPDASPTATPAPPTATPIPPTATPEPLTITNVHASSLQQTSAKINWTTNQPANSRVEYGTTPSLGSSSPLYTSMATSHQVTLTGLKKKTTYYYRARSINASGLESVSSIYSFKTK